MRPRGCQGGRCRARSPGWPCPPLRPASRFDWFDPSRNAIGRARTRLADRCPHCRGALARPCVGLEVKGHQTGRNRNGSAGSPKCAMLSERSSSPESPSTPATTSCPSATAYSPLPSPLCGSYEESPRTLGKNHRARQPTACWRRLVRGILRLHDARPSAAPRHCPSARRISSSVRLTATEPIQNSSVSSSRTEWSASQ